jgi:hypothetical protein
MKRKAVENSKKFKGVSVRKGIARLEMDCIGNVQGLLIYKNDTA